jgi:hypothetical protein
MDSLDNFRERFEALEQQTEQLQRYTRTVERRLRWWRGMAGGLLVLGLLSWASSLGTAQDASSARDAKALEQRVEALEDKLVAVTFDATNNEVVITGANLRIVNGLGNTETTNGLGNLIVGYNESRFIFPDCHPLATDPFCKDTRTGSHNVVVGRLHNFSSFGGLVVASGNEISAAFASVSGGSENTASGVFASVSGGNKNTASDTAAWVSGGQQNTASDQLASVSGGFQNTASGAFASVNGGRLNTASGGGAVVSGGQNITQDTEFGWSAGSEGDEVVVGNFRSP